MIRQFAYNPGFLGREAVVAQFVAREGELSRVMEDLRASRVGHHVLVTGARGMGKTTLLRRVEAELSRDPALSAWLALTFPEEQYNVRTVADFWVNCLDALADAFDADGRAEDARALDADIAGLPDDDPSREADALALLDRYARGRHLLLLVDNLDLLAERIDGWRLRAVLSDPERDLTIVGATSGDALFTADYGKPFLDFFTVVPLDPLSFEEARDLLRALATRDAAVGLLELLERHEGRFYGLFTLSGGNPRTLTQLYTVLSRPDAKEGDIEADLEQLLDQVTPLYKAKFEQLPTQAQQVLDAVAVHWAPVLASTVADTLRMEVTQVSAQLSRLQRLGWVQKVELPGTSKSGFQVAERFFNVWYLVRTSRRMRKKLMLLAECLVALHGKEAVAGRAQRALADPSSRPELLLALSRCVDDPSLSRALDLEALDRLHAAGGSPIALLAAEFDDTPWHGAVELKLRLQAARRSLPGDRADAGRLLAGAPLPPEERWRMLEALARGEDPPLWVDAVWELVRVTACHGIEPAVALGEALANGDLVDLADREGAAALRLRGGRDLERVLRFESASPEAVGAPDAAWLADASAGELIAWSRHDVVRRLELVRLAFERSSAQAATAWWSTYPSRSPLPPEGSLGGSADERFVLGRVLFEAGRHEEAAEVFAEVADALGPSEAFLRDQARLWRAIAWSYSVDEARRQRAREVLSVTFWWPGPYAGPEPRPVVPRLTEFAALVRSQFELVASVLVGRGDRVGAGSLLCRLWFDGRSLALFDDFLATCLPSPEDYVAALIESVVRGDPVPLRLVEAVGARPGQAGTASLLMSVAEDWERAEALALRLRPTDAVDVEHAALLLEVLLQRGHAERLASLLTGTPLGDRLMPYTAAAVALARRDRRELLAWPVEVQQAAREIVDRFWLTTGPASGRPPTHRTRVQGKKAS